MTVITEAGGQAVGAIEPRPGPPTVVALSMGPGIVPVEKTLPGGRPVLPPAGPPPGGMIDVALGKIGGTPVEVGLRVPPVPAVLKERQPGIQEWKRWPKRDEESVSASLNIKNTRVVNKIEA